MLCLDKRVNNRYKNGGLYTIWTLPNSLKIIFFQIVNVVDCLLLCEYKKGKTLRYFSGDFSKEITFHDTLTPDPIVSQ